MTRAYVGLGSNLGDSPGLIREALDRLAGHSTAFQNSDLYVAKPWGVNGQPDYINAVAAFDTDIAPHALLEQLRAIETALGRVRGERFAPRLIDLDLLLYGDEEVAGDDLSLPHPRMRERAFVLGPLAEIAPELKVPHDGKTAASLLADLPAAERATIRRLPGTAVLAPPPRVDYDASGAGERYHDLRPFSSFDRLMFDTMVEMTGPVDRRRVLDVGCGTGRFTAAFTAAGATATGFDASETMLATARAHSPAHAYIRGDANAELPSGPWDIVSAFYCLQYFAVEPWCARVFDVLSPGGRVAVATFPHRHFATTMFGEFFPSLPAIDMGRFPSVPALERALEDAGFVEIAGCEREHHLEDDPAALIARVEAKYLSSFYLVPDAEFRAGLAAMRRAWHHRNVVHRSALGVLVTGCRPVAER